MSWKKVRLSELLKQIKQIVLIDNSKEYKLVTVSNKGIIKQRDIVKGVEIKGEKAFEAKNGAFIYSRLSVHNGAFGIVPLELDGALLTSEMPIFEIGEKILSEFLIYSLQLPTFKYQLEQLTKGVGRTRVKEANFLNLLIDLPNISEQESIIKSIIKTESQCGIISTELTHQLTLVKKLRQQLLQDAVQGKLVEQNPKDEPAGELLEKIKAEKAKLISEKKLKKEKELPPIKPEEIPLEIPENWVWCRLGEIALYSEAGKSYQAQEISASENQVGVIKTSAITSGKFIEDENKLLPNQNSSVEKIRIVKGDIIFCRASGSKGLAGKSCLIESTPKAKLILSDKSIRYVFSDSISKIYIQCFNSSTFAEQYYINLGTKKSTTMNNITREQFNNLPIPLPPLPEQNRIVQKLDELMEYCNELEASIKQSESLNSTLLQQVLREALRPVSMDAEKEGVAG